MPYMMGGFPDRGDLGRGRRCLRRRRRRPGRARGPVLGSARRRPGDPRRRRRGRSRPGRRSSRCSPTASGSPRGCRWCRWPTRTWSSPAGRERFARALADAGAAGAIVPDLPLEEGGEVAAELRAAGLALIPLVAPTTPPERRARICAEAEGFVYLVSDTRTTGERDELPDGARRADRGDQGRLAGPGRGRLRDRHARAGRRRSARSPTA